MIHDAHPRREIPQSRVPGTDGAEVTLTLHAITTDNYTQRITIARRTLTKGRFGMIWTNWRYHDFVLTRRDVLDVIDDLMDRADTLTDEIPGRT